MNQFSRYLFAFCTVVVILFVLTVLNSIMLALIGNQQHEKKNFVFMNQDCGSHDPSKCGVSESQSDSCYSVWFMKLISMKEEGRKWWSRTCQLARGGKRSHQRENVWLIARRTCNVMSKKEKQNFRKQAYSIESLIASTMENSEIPWTLIYSRTLLPDSLLVMCLPSVKQFLWVTDSFVEHLLK
jgi:hypothetical protein